MRALGALGTAAELFGSYPAALTKAASTMATICVAASSRSSNLADVRPASSDCTCVTWLGLVGDAISLVGDVGRSDATAHPIECRQAAAAWFHPLPIQRAG